MRASRFPSHPQGSHRPQRTCLKEIAQVRDAVASQSGILRVTAIRTGRTFGGALGVVREWSRPAAWGAAAIRARKPPVRESRPVGRRISGRSRGRFRSTHRPTRNHHATAGSPPRRFRGGRILVESLARQVLHAPGSWPLILSGPGGKQLARSDSRKHRRKLGNAGLLVRWGGSFDPGEGHAVVGQDATGPSIERAAPASHRR